MGGITPGATPGGFNAASAFTPSGTTPTGLRAMAMATPNFGSAAITIPGAGIPMTPEQLQVYAWQKEIDDRNRPLTDEDLDELLPPGTSCSILLSYSLNFNYFFHQSCVSLKI